MSLLPARRIIKTTVSLRPALKPPNGIKMMAKKGMTLLTLIMLKKCVVLISHEFYMFVFIMLFHIINTWEGNYCNILVVSCLAGLMPNVFADNEFSLGLHYRHKIVCLLCLFRISIYYRDMQNNSCLS